MPYVGIHNGDRVGPWEVEDGTDVGCPLCDDPMRPRCGEGTKRERHFWHYRGTDCSGESDEHRRMKAIAAARARECWPDAEVGIEVATGGIDTVRVADVLVTFDEFHDTLGAGLAIECQYRNEQKDYTQVSWDHAQANYSTVWLESEHFDSRGVNIGAGDWREWVDYWALPPEEFDPPSPRRQVETKTNGSFETKYLELLGPDSIPDDTDAKVQCPGCKREHGTSIGQIKRTLDEYETILCEDCGWGGEIDEIGVYSSYLAMYRYLNYSDQFHTPTLRDSFG